MKDEEEVVKEEAELGEEAVMKMKVAAVGGISESLRMSGVPESMKRGEGRVRLQSKARISLCALLG